VLGCRGRLFSTPHDRQAIDADLRLVSRAWRVARELCDQMPSTALIVQLLDERLSADEPLKGNSRRQSRDNSRLPVDVSGGTLI